MNRIFEVRYIQEEDFKELKGAYKKLNTCNGNGKDPVVKKAIDDSLASIYGEIGNFKRLTLGAFPLGTSNLAGTASIIRVGVDSPFMYVEEPEGMKLTRMQRGTNMAEFAAMVVNDRFEGLGLNHLLTRVRALILRLFSGIMDIDTILSEFLPPLDEDGDKTNAFWRMIVSKIKEDPNKWEKFIKEASRLKGRGNRLDEVTLFQYLTTTDKPEHRNNLVEEFFPSALRPEEITSEARAVTRDVGPHTQGARRSLASTYNENFFQLSGYFPVDGGRNYEAPVQFGALGERTVEVRFANNREDDQTVLSHPEEFLVWEAAANTPKALAKLKMFRTPAIRGGGVIKLPSIMMRTLELRPGDHVRAYQLPYKPRTQTP